MATLLARVYIQAFYVEQSSSYEWLGQRPRTTFWNVCMFKLTLVGEYCINSAMDLSTPVYHFVVDAMTASRRRKHARREVAVASIADDADDDRVSGGVVGHLQRCPH